MRVLTFLLLAVVIGPIAATSAQAKPLLCNERPGVSVAATNVGRVFREARPGAATVLRGCKHGSRKVLRLAVDGACDGAGDLGPVAVAGRYVAVTRLSCDGAARDATVVLFDLKNLRDVLGVAAYGGDNPSPVLSSVSVTELDVSATGALAWVARLTGPATRAQLHLRRPFAPAPELVDAGDVSDIAVTARKLYWLRGGAARSLDL